VSGRDRFEQRLPTRLEELAVPRVPSYFDDVIHATARTRQRPGWSFAERWFPVSSITDRLVTTPRAPMRLVAVALLAILALAALLIVASGSRQTPVPAPFGVAGNGRIAWVDSTGAIVAADPSETRPSVLVAGPGNDRPLFSPDGTRLLYLRESGSGVDLIVAASDGSSPVTVAADVHATGVIWAPDSRSVVLAADGTLRRIDASAGAAPTTLASGVAGTYDWNVAPAMLFRPPVGAEIAYVRDTGDGKAIVLAKADGTSSSSILTHAGSGLSFTDVYGLQWSPDGSRLAVTVALSSDARDTRVYVLNADGSGLHRASNREAAGTIVSESNPAWSPDGRSIAMQVWLADPTSDSQETRPIVVVDVATGAWREVGSVSVNGFDGWGWSPDGASILAVPDSGRIVTIDVATANAHSDAWQAVSGATWQRTLR
jgi:Tol biopolymer transport system component